MSGEAADRWALTRYVSDAARLRLRLELGPLTTGDGRPDPDE